MPTPREGYFLQDGRRVPSVTTVLHGFGDSTGLIIWAARLAREGLDWKEERDRAGRIGTLAHALIEQELSGDVLPLDTEAGEWDKAQSPLLAFREWLGKQYHHKLIAMETPLVSETYGYGGTLDAILSIGRELVLCDWKTSTQIRANYIMQAMAYMQLVREARPDLDISNEALILHLPLGDKPTSTEYRVPWDRDIFEAFLGILKAHKEQDLMRPTLFRVKGERP